MPKMKSNRAAKKRFSRTGSGKIKRNHAYKSHLLERKSRRRKRRLRQKSILAPGDARKVATFINP